MSLIAAMLTFLVTFLVLAGTMDLAALYVFGDATRTRRRLREEKVDGAAGVGIDILRHDPNEGESAFSRFLENFAPMGSLRRLLKQADSDMPVGVFLMLSLFCDLFVVVATTYGGVSFGTSMLCGAISGLLPLAMQFRARTKRLSAIEAQLPDALDLISRTLMAGHAFIMGLKLVAEQTEDPLAGEFRQTFESINFGVSVADAMTELSERVDSVDVRFFVTALLVQLETGGNLAEIIGSISRLIRARFELLGKVQALSAEGRISAGVMFSLPLGVGSLLYLINPDYMALLYTDPLGIRMTTVGGTMMILGLFITRRMINIKV